MTDLQEAQQALQTSISRMSGKPKTTTLTVELQRKAQHPSYKITEKYRRWEQCFFDKKDKETYGNATQSVIKAYNLDPVTQYDTARLMGSENLAKHNNIIKGFYEAEGITPAKMYQILFNKMLSARTPDLWYAIAESMEIPTPNYKPVTNATYVMQQTTNQVSVGGEMSLSFIQGEEVKQEDAS